MGQREHLTLILIMPYMAMAAIRLSKLQVLTFEATLVGIIGGIGIAIKPHFLIVPVFVELVVYYFSRKISHIWRLEVIGGFFTIFAYWCIVLIFSPFYILEIVPLLMKSRWGWDKTYLYLIISGGVSIMPLFIVAILARKFKDLYLAYIFVAAGLGFSACYFIQRQGFAYHKLPIMILSLLSLVIIFGKIASLSRRKHKDIQISYIIVAALMILFAAKIEEVTQWHRAL